MKEITCSWGSIISGQRKALVTMIPFDVDKSSLGKKLICQFRISYGWPQIAMKLKWIYLRSVSAITAGWVRMLLKFFTAWYFKFFAFSNPNFSQLFSIIGRECASISDQSCCHKNITDGCFGFNYKLLNSNEQRTWWRLMHNKNQRIAYLDGVTPTNFFIW